MNARAARRASNKQARAQHSRVPTREELRRQVEREQQIADAEKQIADAGKQIADAGKQIADLERKLATRKRNSTNSSKPPSSDGMAGPQRRRCSPRKKSGRKPGLWG